MLNVEEALLTALRACAPDGREVDLNLGLEGPEAERILLDYWADLPTADRGRVWCVAGALAGALMRFDDRPSVAFALLRSPGLDSGRPANAQARSLLMAAYPDTWTLALERGPQVDADQWRCRLSAVVAERWGIGLVEHPAAAYDALMKQLRLEPSLTSATRGFDFRTEISTNPVRPLDRQDWLDVELYENCLPAEASAKAGASLAGKRDVTPVQLSPSPVETRRGAGLESKVLRGKAGRLFLARDSHDSHRQVIGERPLSSEELDAWERGTAARMADLEALGCRLIQLIGPSPQVVHADDLPDSMSISDTRPARQVLERLRAMQPRPEILYPLAELMSVSGLHAFSKTDSHWNDLGAYLAYEAVLAQLGEQCPIRRVERADVSFQETCYTGDLGSKLRPERASIFLRARLDHPHARLVDDNRVRNHGRKAVFECETAPPTTCLVFGDSWAYPMLLYLAESFRRVVFRHRVNVIDRRPIQQEHPDVVLMVLTERFCTALPNDDEAPNFEDVVARKLRAGDLIPEAPPPKERHPFLFSLQLDRGLPSGSGFRLPTR